MPRAPRRSRAGLDETRERLNALLTPAARERVAETHACRDQLVRDQTMSTFGTEEFRGLGGLTNAEPHWSEREDTRGNRYADPGRTGDPEHE